MKNVHLDLDFAPKRRKVSLPALGVLATAILLFILTVLQAAFKVAENARQSGLIANANSAISRSTAPVKPARLSASETARIKFVRQTSSTLATPWADLLLVLESAPSNVALLQLDPSASKRSLSLTAEAAGPAEMLNYLQTLQSDKRLSNVVLVSHQVQLQAPGTPWRFKVRANWGETP
ncbi:hypothetical protein [Rhodoferax sp.]|uniref:hypothetical protein n=1 Tax=Rhodoferax sp. TaxID=50421 RepID=UPI00283B9860|nr:hypothetical protein [Rhodoferax sp.]MDR3370139.1 hypothetical protein [Rhodoferax sp.]